MAIGLEITFVFDKEIPIGEILKLKHSYDFDIRNGFGLIMSGQDWAEIDEPDRLLIQIERELDIKLSLLDYWDVETYETEIDCKRVLEVLERLKAKIEVHPEFYTKIDYSFDVAENYLKLTFLSDVQFLIQLIRLHLENGVRKMSYQID